MDRVFMIDIPVQMISCTDTNGRITPMRFRFRDKNTEIVTVEIEKIIKSDLDTNRIGASFLCGACIYGVQRTFMLRYNFAAHEWRLTQVNL